MKMFKKLQMGNNEFLSPFKAFRKLCWPESFDCSYYKSYALAISISVLFEKNLGFVHTEPFAFSSKSKVFLTDRPGTEQRLNLDFPKS